MAEWWKILIAILIPLLGGMIGGYLSIRGSSDWYNSLNVPSFSPPGYVVGPVWFILFICMGLASYFVYRDGKNCRGRTIVALIFYSVQLVLNWAWPVLYFAVRSLKWSFIDLAVLLVVAIATGVQFFFINRAAGYLYIPYILWLSLATTDTYLIYRNNP